MGETTSGARAVLSIPAIYELWSRLAGGYRARDTFVREFVRPQPGLRVLDLGCGPGDLFAHLGDVRYVGVDISEAYIARARERFGGQASFRVGDATAVAGEERFDVAIAVGVLHHIDDAGVRKMLEGVAPMLGEGGRLVTIDPTFTPGQSRVARAIIKRDRGNNVRSPDGYAALAGGAFEHVDVTVREDLLTFPYTHCILEAH